MHILRFGAEALFKEDDQTVEDKSKALYEDSIDAILARAEVRRPSRGGHELGSCRTSCVFVMTWTHFGSAAPLLTSIS